MEAHIDAESAFQLFAAYRRREYVADFYKLSHVTVQNAAKKMPQIYPGDIVELVGDTGTGKSELVMQVIAVCILPRSWTFRIPGENGESRKVNVALGGHGTGAICLDCDQRFTMLRVHAMLVSLARKALKEAKISVDMLTTTVTKANEDSYSDTPNLATQLDHLACESLTRLRLARPQSSLELLATLISIDSYLKAAEAVRHSIVVVDSMSSFFWADYAQEGSGSRKSGNLDEEDMLIARLEASASSSSSSTVAEQPAVPGAVRQTIIQISVTLKNLAEDWSLAFFLTRWDVFRNDRPPGSKRSAKLPCVNYLMELKRAYGGRLAGSLDELPSGGVHFFSFDRLA